MANARTGPFGEMFHVEPLTVTINAAVGITSTVLYLDTAYDQTPEMAVLGSPVNTEQGDFTLAYAGGAAPTITVSAANATFTNKYVQDNKFTILIHAHAKLVT